MTTPPGFYDVIPDDSADEEKEKPRKYECKSLPDFVEHLLAMFPKHRGNNEVIWCREWYEHPEAVNRLQALWDSWEHVRLEPSSLSAWIRDHADYHLGVLIHPQGPFKGCVMGDANTPASHRDDPATPLPIKRPPPGLFEVYDDEE